MQLQSVLSFEGVREWSNEFLLLFPHRYDYIYAKQVAPDASPSWQTESRHLLTDRLIQQGTFLYGVRFGAKTQYCLIDIDTGSAYHPQHDPFAISRILAALESIGLVSYIVCTSSYSGGIHLYFPFVEAQKTWQLAIALQSTLENAGFKPTLGQLELFPNAKPYIAEGTPSLYTAHRLPMQAGSYLLNDDWQPIYSSQTAFVQQWRLAQSRNDVHAAVIEQILKTAYRQRYSLSGKADKFLNDLNADIESGWTGYGQTNYLLGRIAMRSYIFAHILYASHPLEGGALVDDIIRVATALPGYRDWCRHHHEIQERAEEWARCVENSRYFHFGQQKQQQGNSTSSQDESALNWNQQRSEAARTRIRQAIADLLNQGCLPATATARFAVLLRYHIGGSTLYKHRDLWHPLHLLNPESADVLTCPVENPPDPPDPHVDYQCDRAEGASYWHNPTSLLSGNERNPLQDQGLSDRPPQKPLLSDSNASIDRAEAYEEQHIARMQQFLASGDPILVAEALSWAAMNLQGLNLETFSAEVAYFVPRFDVGVDQGRSSVQDWSDILVAISVQVRRLAWSTDQVEADLMTRFGKRSQAGLDDLELVEWLGWLQQQESTPFHR